jgi:Family of unknown function (DUF6065)
MSNFIKLNYLFDEFICKVVQSPTKRDWMDATPNKFAYRCLPLSIANHITYDCLCPSTIKATWEGDHGYNGVKVEYLNKSNFNYAGSEFGSGILTFHVDFIISSSENASIYVKGPANRFKKNINALDAIVETHWLPFTFTFNWKFYEPGEVIFEEGEPMFSFFPINLDYVESFEPKLDFIKNDTNFNSLYQAYTESRSQHLKDGTTNGSDWQKYYMKGISPLVSEPNKHHKSKINLKQFHYEK